MYVLQEEDGKVIHIKLYIRMSRDKELISDGGHVRDFSKDGWSDFIKGGMFRVMKSGEIIVDGEKYKLFYGMSSKSYGNTFRWCS